MIRTDASAVGQAGGDGRGAVAGEDRRVDRLQPAERQDRHDRLDQHRQQDSDPVARPDPVRVEAADGEIDLGGQFAVREPADRAVLAFPGERRPVWVPGGPWRPRRRERSSAHRRATIERTRSLGSRRAPSPAAGPRRGPGHPRRRPRTTRDQHTLAPAGHPASAGPSSAGTWRAANRAGGRRRVARPRPRCRARRSASPAAPPKGTRRASARFPRASRQARWIGTITVGAGPPHSDLAGGSGPVRPMGPEYVPVRSGLGRPGSAPAT